MLCSAMLSKQWVPCVNCLPASQPVSLWTKYQIATQPHAHTHTHTNSAVIRSFACKLSRSHTNITYIHTFVYWYVSLHSSQIYRSQIDLLASFSFTSFWKFSFHSFFFTALFISYALLYRYFCKVALFVCVCVCVWICVYEANLFIYLLSLRTPASKQAAHVRPSVRSFVRPTNSATSPAVDSQMLLSSIKYAKNSWNFIKL